MVLGDALDEEEVVAVYGSLETGGWVDHCMVIDIRLYCSQSGRKGQIVVEIHILFSGECIMIELDGRNLVHADYGVLPSCRSQVRLSTSHLREVRIQAQDM